jgi:hypothetical protein
LGENQQNKKRTYRESKHKVEQAKISVNLQQPRKAKDWEMTPKQKSSRNSKSKWSISMSRPSNEWKSDITLGLIP